MDKLHELKQRRGTMKANLESYTNSTYQSVNEPDSKVEEIAVEVTRLLAEKNLNFRQAFAVLELVQAEIKECELKY